MIVHHFFSILLLNTPWAGFSVPGYSIMLLGMEVSSIPMVIRRYVAKDSLAEKVNNVCFLLAFTVFRLMLAMILFYLWPGDSCGIVDRQGYFKFTRYFNFIACGALTVLNCIWYKIILQKAFCPKKEKAVE